MISHIKNPWVRRALVIIFYLPTMIMAGSVGMLVDLIDSVEQVHDAAREAWRGLGAPECCARAAGLIRSGPAPARRHISKFGQFACGRDLNNECERSGGVRRGAGPQ